MAEELLEFCKAFSEPKNINFYYGPDEMGSCDIPTRKIYINVKYKKKRILTFAHEVFHFHLKFKCCLDALLVYHDLVHEQCYRDFGSDQLHETKEMIETYKKYTGLEKEITKFARQVLNSNPDIMRLLAKNFYEAYRSQGIIDEELEKNYFIKQKLLAEKNMREYEEAKRWCAENTENESMPF